MTAQRLLDKLELQAERNSQREWEQRRNEAAHPTLKPDVLEDQKLNRLCNLRKKTANIEFTLELDRQLEAESKRNLVATMKLRESRLTTEERRLRAVETQRGQLLYSRIIPELSPTWREEATAAFKAKKL